MSLGVHRIWKNEFVNSIGNNDKLTNKQINKLGVLKPNIRIEGNKHIKEKLKIIDVAGGTGDIAFRIWDRANDYSKSYLESNPIDLTIVDINKAMLEVGETRALERGIPKDSKKIFQI